MVDFSWFISICVATSQQVMGRSGRPHSGGSVRASGTSRWSESYHGMSSAVAAASSDAGSNLDFDASEVSSVLETSADRHA